MKKYHVQKERDLKNIMREECEQQNTCILDGIINHYRWSYYKHCNDLEIYVDGTSSSSSSTEIADCY